MPLRTLAITPGEPAGIGPDLCVKLAHNPPADVRLVVVGDPQLLQARASQLGLPLTLSLVDTQTARTQTQNEAKLGHLFVVPESLIEAVNPGRLNSANSRYVLRTLDKAIELAKDGSVDAVVTGPVQKSVINEAGISFSGHTEYFAEKCQVPLTVMMLATQGLRVALTTTHLPVVKISAAITQELLTQIIAILHHDLKTKFGLADPKILVCGLNPHAGENGHLGTEEIDIIQPVLNTYRQQGFDLVGPLPADTLFTDKYLKTADAVLAMYHDQGLPVLKYKGFGDACNITLGLPIIRTSVDHGTALDLAGSGQVDTGSLYNAIRTAVAMVGHWQAADKNSKDTRS